MRARAADFAKWSALGMQGWSFDDVLASYKAVENAPDGDDRYRGRSGPLPIRTRRRDCRTYEVFLESGANVYTVAEKSDTVQAAGGLSITPKYTFDNAKTRILRFGARPRMRGQQQQASR